MTITDRVAAFKTAFAKWPASWPLLVKESGRDVLYATWCIGNDYRNPTKYYGAYPNGYIDRVMALFPDVLYDQQRIAPTPDAEWPVLHVFSGSLPVGPYVRVDVQRNEAKGVNPDYVASVYDLSWLRGGSCNYEYALVFADPPYSAADAERYLTPMVDRRRALHAIASVTKPGGHLVWLDTVWPMHRKDDWLTVGRITVVRSTNHRVRMATIFERAA